ncbi:ABC transporter permease [Actinomadura rudentiformis]|uniref:Transport permease protein n=1 Tax=Actinomadura rudentiformis TaxID=359158 RepID=A0A6H9YN82_9ACTN|nr:ABC transporter permease [Actinomadura rudentiformis]KAB2346144.1 ABC transporter permease [Actinomadura rudentiformis]
MTTVTHRPAGTPQISWLSAAMTDSAVLTRRYVNHILRQPEEIVMAVLIPTVMMLLFRYMLGGAIDARDAGSYANFLVPGVMAVCVTLIAVSTTVSVFMDMQEGFVDRFRSMSMMTTSIIVGHVMAAVLRAAIALSVVIALGLAIGFRPKADPLQWLFAMAIMALFAVSVAWVSALFGQIAKTADGASGLGLILAFLPYASNVFTPTDMISEGLRHFVANQPVTAVIDAVRALLLDQPVHNNAWLAILWWGGILAVAVPLSNRVFRRRFS